MTIAVYFRGQPQRQGQLQPASDDSGSRPGYPAQASLINLMSQNNDISPALPINPPIPTRERLFSMDPHPSFKFIAR